MPTVVVIVDEVVVVRIGGVEFVIPGLEDILEDSRPGVELVALDGDADLGIAAHRAGGDDEAGLAAVGEGEVAIEGEFELILL